MTQAWDTGFKFKRENVRFSSFSRKPDEMEFKKYIFFTVSVKKNLQETVKKPSAAFGCRRVIGSLPYNMKRHLCDFAHE